MPSISVSMPKTKLIFRSRLVLALACIQGLACLAWIFSIPSDADSGVFLGFSPARWAMAGFVVALTGLCAGLLLGLSREKIQDKFLSILQRSTFQGSLISICVLSITAIVEVLVYFNLVNTPLEKSLSARLLPVFTLLALLSIELIVLAAGLALARRVEWNAPLKVTLALWALLTAAGAAILVTRFGIQPTTITWYEYGVPLASVQLLAILGVALLGVVGVATAQRVRSRRGTERPRSGWWVDLILVLAIWAGAAAAWSALPIKDSWLTPRPLPPNAEIYPNSDALLYDSTANGIWFGTDWAHNVDIHAKPFYTAFLVLLHTVAGQDYEKVALLQTIFLGLFPVALYLLGKSLHSRVAGVCIALAAILREVNQLSLAQLTTLSTSKMLLSELPTALGIAVFLIVVVVWLKNPSRRLALAVLAGGVLGLLVQVRIQAIVFLPVLLALVMIQLRSKWKAGLILSGLVCLGFLVSVTPLLYRNWKVSGTITLEKLGYLQRTLEFSYTPTGSIYGVDSKSPFATPTAKQTGNLLDWMTISGTHFAHNAVSTFLTVSSRLGPRGNWTAIKDLQALFWLKPPVPPSWPTAVSYILNLGLFSLGVAALWHRHHWLGLTPVIFYGVYSLSSAASGFSAQRFILPVDWVGYFYFFAGLVSLIMVVFSISGWETFHRSFPSPTFQALPPFKPQMKPIGAILAVLLLLGGLMPLEEAFIPVRYPALDPAEMRARLTQTSGDTLRPEQQALLGELLARPDTELLHGVALYPRVLTKSTQETYGLIKKGQAITFPFLTYEYIGSEEARIFQPVNKNQALNLPNASPVVVAGTRTSDGLYAFATLNLVDGQIIFNPPAPEK